MGWDEPWALGHEWLAKPRKEHIKKDTTFS